MKTNPKRFILAACLSATIACAGLAGCQSQSADDRTAGTRIDDKHAAERVREALAKDPLYKFPNVNVQVYNGTAQLSGFAETKPQKDYAAQIASEVRGVRQLINGIVVKPLESTSPAGYEYGRPYPPPSAPTTAQPNDNIQNPNNSHPSQP
jgi:BON domain